MDFLIVDNHAGMRAMIRHLAGRFATSVRESDTGEAAIEAARARPPDIVTMDLGLPGQRGIEAMRTLRQICPRTRIIVLTAYDQPEFRLAAEEAGAAHFISKDAITELEAVLARFADQARPSPKTTVEG